MASTRACGPSAEAVASGVVDSALVSERSSRGRFAVWEFATYRNDFGDCARFGMRWAWAGLFVVCGGGESRCESDVLVVADSVLACSREACAHPSALSVATLIGPLALLKKMEIAPLPQIFLLLRPALVQCSSLASNESPIATWGPFALLLRPKRPLLYKSKSSRIARSLGIR